MPAQMALSDLATAYQRVAEAIKRVQREDPSMRDAYVVRNEVGNLSVIRDSEIYAGYINTLTGEVDIF
jgi:hypothetical protein